MPLIRLHTRGKFISTCVRIISSIVKNKNKSQVSIISLDDFMKSEDMKSQSREYEKWDDHALDKLLE
jgi:uridine kinase